MLEKKQKKQKKKKINNNNNCNTIKIILISSTFARPSLNDCLRTEQIKKKKTLLKFS